MALKLDHVVIAVDDLEQAMVDYRELGFTVIYGGIHASGTTHNALICFKDSSYLELLAPTGEAPKPGAMDFSHLLQHGEGVVGYALASDNLTVDAGVTRARGIEVGEVNEGGRKREDGIELRWKTALIDGNMSPFLIQDITPRHLRVPDDETTTTHENAAYGISGVLMMTAEFNRTNVSRYERLLNVEGERDPLFKRYRFPIGASSLLLDRAKSFEDDMRILDAIRSDFRGYIDQAEELLSDEARFNSDEATQLLSEAHNLASNLTASHHDISGPHFQKFGGRDAPYGIHIRVTALPRKPFDFSKTHHVVLIDQLDLSVLPDDEDKTIPSRRDSTLPF